MKIKNIMFDLGGVIMTIDQPSAVKRFKEIGLEDAERRLDPYTQSGIFGDLEEGKSRLKNLSANSAGSATGN